MLEELIIENFALINHLDLNFKKGENVFLGQTGAGKSIIIEAINLLTGARVEFSKVRDENKKAFVQACFKFSPEFIKSHPILNDYLDGENLYITRTLFHNKNTIKANGEIISANTLKNLMSNVIDIFSQGEASFLINESKQLSLLDSYGKDKIKNALENYQKSYDLYLKLLKEEKEFLSTSKVEMKDFYAYQVKEIESYNLKENEIEDLNDLKDKMSKYEDLQEAYKGFIGLFNGEYNINDALDSLKNNLYNLKDSLLDKNVDKILDDISILEDDIKDLESNYDNLDFDPQKLDEINARLFSLSTLQHKFGKTTDEILAKYDEYKKELEKIDNYSQIVNSFKEKKEAILSDLKAQALKLSNIRKDVADGLKKECNEQLESLGLLKDGFNIEFAEKELDQHGIDNVQFLVCLNKGSKFLTLKNALSGGENARLNLALKVVFNNQSNSDTLILDEIDTGISGSIALKAGKKIKELSKKSMVIVISHLPQVICYADNAFLVYKKEEKGITNSYVTNLNEEDFIKQIALISSGLQLTDSSLQVAKDLRKAALDNK